MDICARGRMNIERKCFWTHTHTHTHTHIYIYIHTNIIAIRSLMAKLILLYSISLARNRIYMCVCVWVCVYMHMISTYAYMKHLQHAHKHTPCMETEFGMGSVGSVTAQVVRPNQTTWKMASFPNRSPFVAAFFTSFNFWNKSNYTNRLLFGQCRNTCMVP